MSTIHHHTHDKDVHTFTLSGLGDAPFTICHPGDVGAKANTAFFCEHCGTAIKNRYFVKSTDGKVSVVGVDCLKKTGDAGLTGGVKRLRRQLRHEAREEERCHAEEERKAKDRMRLNGKTREECIAEIEDRMDSLREEHRSWVELHPLYQHLRQPGFERAMLERALCGEPLSASMCKSLVDILAKKVSRARRNSRAYRNAALQAQGWVFEVRDRVIALCERLEADRERINRLYRGEFE